MPDDWQHEVLVDWLGIGRNRKWLARTCGLAVPRQNGKNGIIEVRELFGMIVLGEKFLHTAHEVKTARKAFKRLKFFFGDAVNDPGAKFPELNALVEEIRSTNGQEAIVLANGGSVEFVARSKGSGRGFTVDVLVCDEAQDLTDEELEALLPTISAAPLGNPQIIFTGTPPNPEKSETGEVFVRVREDGVSGADRSLSWTDFGVEDGPLEAIHLDEIDLLYATNPALEAGRLQLEVCRTERRRMSAAGYARERFGWWGNRNGAGSSMLPEWPNRGTGEPLPSDPPTIGIAVDLKLEWACLGAAALRPDGRIHVSVPDDETGRLDHARGTAWLIPRVKELQARHGCTVLIDEKCPDADLADRLRDAGVQVTELKLEQMLEACSGLINAVVEGTLTHFDQPDLNAAVGCASTRTVSERPLWARKSGDITPLEAVTIARWGAESLNYDIADSIL